MRLLWFGNFFVLALNKDNGYLYFDGSLSNGKWINPINQKDIELWNMIVWLKSLFKPKMKNKPFSTFRVASIPMLGLAYCGMKKKFIDTNGHLYTAYDLILETDLGSTYFYIPRALVVIPEYI